MYLLGRTTDTTNALDRILKHAYRNRYIKFDNGLLEIASIVFARIMYVSSAQNMNPKIIDYLTNEKIGKLYFMFLKEIPEELCKKVKCIPNHNTFTKTIYFSGLESVIIYAKPDAFMNNFPVEIKSIFIRKDNSEISKYLGEIGEYQARIYGYIFNTKLSYLIRCSYELNSDGKPLIRKYALRTLLVDQEEIDKKIKRVLKDIIFPFFTRN